MDGAENPLLKSGKIIDGKHGHGFRFGCNSWVGGGCRRMVCLDGFLSRLRGWLWGGLACCLRMRFAGGNIRGMDGNGLLNGFVNGFIDRVMRGFSGNRFLSLFGVIAGWLVGRLLRGFVRSFIRFQFRKAG